MIERTILFWITHWGGEIYALLLYIWNIRLIGFPVLVLVKRTTIRARNRTIILNIAFAYYIGIIYQTWIRSRLIWNWQRILIDTVSMLVDYVSFFFSRVSKIKWMDRLKLFKKLFESYSFSPLFFFADKNRLEYSVFMYIYARHGVYLNREREKT